jgi:hypothetical protein
MNCQSFCNKGIKVSFANLVCETCLLWCGVEAPAMHALIDDSSRQPQSAVLREALAFSEGAARVSKRTW